MHRKGFTLIDLMIVVAIIVIIAAIALPGILRSRMAANEANAIGALRTRYNAQIQFLVSREKLVGNVPKYGTFTELGVAIPPFLDAQLGAIATPVKSNYVFTFIDGSYPEVPSFAITATSQSEKHGSRNFYVNDSGVIRWIYETIGSATSSDQPI